jgi:hypothetical protein
MKKRVKTQVPEIKVIYRQSALDPEEAERRLDAAFDVLFDAVEKRLESEEMPGK